MKHSIELLSPAGDLQRAKIAIRYGADAVYLGGKKFSLRSRASNFDIEDIATIRFDSKDVVRHPLVSKIIQAYEKKSIGN